MRIQAFTWQDFLLAALILSVVWYVMVGLLFYRAEIAAFFSGRGKIAEPLGHSWQDKVDDLPEGLMGEAAGEPGVAVLEAEDFSFMPKKPAERGADPLGDLADVQQEIKDICVVLKAGDGTKEDFFLLFEVVREKYPKVFAAGASRQLAGFILGQLPFELSEDELAGLWD